MSDHATDFASFLIEEYRDIQEEDRPSVIRERFPRISQEEFLRGFAIAEEIALDDASEVLLAGAA